MQLGAPTTPAFSHPSFPEGGEADTIDYKFPFI